MKNFAWVMGLLFGSAGTYTYLKSGQVARPLDKVKEKNRIKVYLDLSMHLQSFYRNILYIFRFFGENIRITWMRYCVV